MIDRLGAWTKRHPRITYTAYLVVMVLVLGEIGVRLFVRFDPSYYMGHAKPAPGVVVKYPYGTISYNSDGYPDAEFDAVKTRPRVGYVGDSVCLGVGAGYGYRVSELVEEALPEYEHLNLTRGLGADISTRVVKKIVEVSDRFDLDLVVYLMNLNDVVPDSKPPGGGNGKSGASGKGGKGGKGGVSSFARRTLNALRGSSYLYTYVRYVAMNVAVRRGYNATGQQAYERFPEQYSDIVAGTASRVRALAARLEEKGVAFVVVLLPYEMQISQDAGETYAAKGITWEGDAFLDRGPQRMLLGHFDGLTVIDAYYAFVDPQDPSGREKYRVGDCFVYNRGDKLDWNHPNREGHRLIADYILRQGKLREALERLSETRQ